MEAKHHLVPSRERRESRHSLEDIEQRGYVRKTFLAWKSKVT